MRSPSHAFFLTTGLLLALLHLPLPVSCVDKSLLASPEGMPVEDKIRLGSTPPSCHNRCDLCNPCTAVQVPTLPVQSTPVRSRVRKVRPSDDDPFSYGNQYSNYKPLGWRCSCGNRLYNP
ncbi:hypothetical protein OPV22_011270 [Ensete ventricosum]|uniref:Epidermal patterning factor-like protein n=1 Tax=Ensete ventricosum TaxID=4639 RepID=A0AAV8RK47_ENSVE|nr:hypothetical protein OPV22_011270 [Ensete ventricosum]RWV91718.1 hypothetical protein GW17_00045970 [Ensete ventricosum]